jgi:hypothetical protein
MTRGCIVEEYEDAGLGDGRLDSRLVQIATRLEANPCASFPKAFSTEAELEGFYRFIRNDRVTPDGILEPHIQATVDRLGGSRTTVAIHDTTEFRFKGDREGLGRLMESGRGFLGHFSMLVHPGEVPEPLGVAAVHTWARTKETPTQKRKAGTISYRDAREADTEQRRWGRQVDEVEQGVAGAASLVHVMDSEADDYALLAKLVGDSRRFVVRQCYDRLLDVKESASGPHGKTKAFLATGQTVCTRTVKVSKRKRHPSGEKKARVRQRKQRIATLAITAMPVVFRRPCSQSTQTPKRLPVNIVQVREVNPPRDVEPVEWLLTTSEPIDTEEEISRIVDFYRIRWLIEEYFKALKTGCAYEKRQLDSLQTLLAALAVFVPIAWSLLRLRYIARTAPTAPAESVVTPTQLRVLRLAPQCRLTRKPTTRDVMLAIARLGGHLKSNGEPGWQVLGRGYEDLLLLTAGYVLAAQEK